MAARSRVGSVARRAAIEAERRWDRARRSRREGRPPESFRIVPYRGHGSGDRVRVRGRVLDNPEPSAAEEGEGTWAAVRRTVSHFLTDELPDVPLRVSVGSAEVETVTDEEGYFDVEVAASLPGSAAPWVVGEVTLLAPYRGVTGSHAAEVRIRVAGAGAEFGVVSDIDDTILVTGVQRAAAMVAQTITGNALTRTPFVGAPELYRAFAAPRPGATAKDANPVFYVSSSPWNLHAFLTAFLDHRDFPRGPLLLRDLLGTDPHRSKAAHKYSRIVEVLDLNPDLPFVLIGDSGEADPEIYAEVVRRHPDRIVAVYIREVRLDPGDRRVEMVTDDWEHDVPFVLAADSAAVARHAASLGLISPDEARAVEHAVAADGLGPRDGRPPQVE